MKNFIKALYADLLDRVNYVITELRSNKFHADIQDRFINDTVAEFEEIKKDLEHAFKTGVLEHELITRNNIFRFNRLHREYKGIHSYRYLALRNYKDPEIFLFRIISQIYREHRISAIPPIVCTISNQDDYYWAVPDFEIIALPAGEEKSLLNLPDLYHEIGHLLDAMFKGKSSEKTGKIIDRHFAGEIVRLIDDGFPTQADTVKETRRQWSEGWLEEFTCDLVGTYMTGAAYAWTNLKLLTIGHGSTQIYEYLDTHPADEARMRIIILMLEKLGLVKEKNAVESAWALFLKDTHPYKPSDYDLLFPQQLLKEMVHEFYEFYQNADLVSYPELQHAGDNSIAGMLNKAWMVAQSDPMDYFSFETTAIKSLRRAFGVDGQSGT